MIGMRITRRWRLRLPCLRERARGVGFTLVELLLVVALFSFIFLGASGMYLSALKFMDNLSIQGSQIAPLYAVEHISRNAASANWIAGEEPLRRDEFRVIRFRVDKKNTTFRYDDDVWVVYGLVGGRLRWKEIPQPALTPELGASGESTSAVQEYYDNPPLDWRVDHAVEVQDGLVFKSGSKFNYVQGDNRVNPPVPRGFTVGMDFIVETGRPPKETRIRTSATARNMVH